MPFFLNSKNTLLIFNIGKIPRFITGEKTGYLGKFTVVSLLTSFFQVYSNNLPLKLCQDRKPNHKTNLQKKESFYKNKINLQKKESFYKNKVSLQKKDSIYKKLVMRRPKNLSFSIPTGKLSRNNH